MGEGNSVAVEVSLGVFCRAEKQQANLPHLFPVSDVAYSHSLMHAWIHLPSLSHSRRLRCCSGHPVPLMLIMFTLLQFFRCLHTNTAHLRITKQACLCVSVYLLGCKRKINRQRLKRQQVANSFVFTHLPGLTDWLGIFHTHFPVNYWDKLSGTTSDFNYSRLQLH